MKKNMPIWFVILLFMVFVGLVSGQVRPLKPTPPNPAPNIPAPSVPKVTPPMPATPVPAGPISQTISALPETDKQPVKSLSDKAAADQGSSENIVIAVIAAVMLVFGILIGRMSVKTKRVKEQSDTPKNNKM